MGRSLRAALVAISCLVAVPSLAAKDDCFGQAGPCGFQFPIP